MRVFIAPGECKTALKVTILLFGQCETRFKYVPELQKMGADIEVKGRNAFVRGVPKLHGASLVAGDLRGGAALVIAALGAEGVSEVLDLSHIDRGYSDLQGKLKNLGAEIKRVRV